MNAAVSASTVVGSTALTQGHAATALTPVTASGGTGTLTYSVSPALPSGLNFASNASITGTPAVPAAATLYLVTATDANGSTGTATFSLTVNPAIVTVTAAAQTVLIQNRAAAAFTPVTATGGTGTLTYTVAPTLPSGLSFSSTGVVTGTPPTVSSAATFVVTVSDSLGATGTASFTLAVDAAVVAVTVAPQTVFFQNRAAIAFSPVTGSGGTGTLAYTVAPVLPAGLSFSSTGVVSGTPAVTRTATAYTVSVTDADGITATATFTLTVNRLIATATAVSSSSLAPAFGTPVTLTATINPAPTDTPVGTVNFYTGTTLLGNSALNGAGVATLTASLLQGPNSVTAVFSGSARYDGSTSIPSVVSSRAGTTTTLTTNLATQLAGNPVVLTAMAASDTTGVLTGTVTFLDGTSVVATVPLGAGGVTVYSTSSLAAGVHPLSAAYSGDPNFAGSASSPTATSVTVADLNLYIGGDQNQTVVPGAAVAYNFALSPW